MLRHIWVNLQKQRLVIGSHFQQLYHLLVSALTSSQVPNGQVYHLIFCLKLVMQRGETTIVADLCYFLPLYTCRCYFCETRVQVRKQKK